MIVVGDFEIAFVHIIKTGGTSITDALTTSFGNRARTAPMLPGFRELFLKIPSADRNGIQNPGHAPAKILRQYAGPSAWDACQTVTSVRNPWDLIYSLYRFIGAHPKHPQFEIVKDLTFDQFIEFEFGRRVFSQWDWISENNELLVKHVLRFESLANDYRQLAQCLGISVKELPHLNKSDRGGYRLAYSQRGMEQVARRFKVDIERFGYSF
jgi:hypothetical protein